MKRKIKVYLIALIVISVVFLLFFFKGFIGSKNFDQLGEYDIRESKKWEVMSLDQSKEISIDDTEQKSKPQAMDSQVDNPTERLNSDEKEENIKEEEYQEESEKEKSYAEHTIDRINEKTRADERSGVKDLSKITHVAFEALVQLIESYQLPGQPYLNGVPITEEDRQRLYASRNLDGIPGKVEIRYGIITRNAAVRSFPTREKISKNSLQEDFDYFQESMFLIGEPVLVYHNSANGEFSFVQGSNYYGWVQKDSIGLCTKEDQEKWINESSFILFTNETYIDGFRIRMGTRLPIIKEKNSHYIANFPLQQNHQLVLKPVIIGKSNEVNKGYLDYTEENIKQLAARLLGMPYGWGDTDEDMDCSSTIGAIFRCFGIILPRNTSSLPYTGGTVTDVSGFREEEKRNILLQQKVGSIFIMPGHVVMYMGEIDGMPMIFHNFTKYSKDGSELLWEYHADITALDIFGGSGLSYPSLIQFILNFR